MIIWWGSLDIVSQIFMCVAIPATLVLIIQTVLMFIGMENDALDGDGGLADDFNGVGADAFTDEITDLEADHGGLDAFRIFTVRGIVAFLVVFGWVGYVMNNAGIKLWLTLPIAVICGFAIMVVLALLMHLVMKLRNDGNKDNRNTVGVSGKVYLTVPALRKGEGKVSIMLQGSLVERDAVTDDEEDIPTGSEVVVVGISGQTTLVVVRK